MYCLLWFCRCIIPTTIHNVITRWWWGGDQSPRSLRSVGAKLNTLNRNRPSLVAWGMINHFSQEYIILSVCPNLPPPIHRHNAAAITLPHKVGFQSLNWIEFGTRTTVVFDNKNQSNDDDQAIIKSAVLLPGHNQQNSSCGSRVLS